MAKKHKKWVDANADGICVCENCYKLAFNSPGTPLLKQKLEKDFENYVYVDTYYRAHKPTRVDLVSGKLQYTPLTETEHAYCRLVGIL